MVPVGHRGEIDTCRLELDRQDKWDREETWPGLSGLVVKLTGFSGTLGTNRLGLAGQIGQLG